MMGLKKKINDYLNKRKAKKNSIEPDWIHIYADSKLVNPTPDYCILKDNIEHQGIGGKKAYFDRDITINDIIENASAGAIGCINFIERRPDLFKKIGITDSLNITRRSYSCCFPTEKANKRKFHYVKIWNTNKLMYPEYTYLGYVICSDEIKKVYNSGDKNVK